MMKQSSKNRTFYLACILLALSGCAPLNTTNTAGSARSTPSAARSSSPAASLLIYLEYVRNLSAADYAHELDHARDLAAESKSVYRTLQYALALSLPGGDSRKAQQLIEALPKENKNIDPELAALSNLVGADLIERRRLEVDLKRAEGDAKKADTESKRADTEAKRAETEMKRADDLQSKLDALKDIEKKLIDRKKVRTDK
jgi:hypothetical protein